MKQQLEMQENMIKDLHDELDKQKIHEINDQQHWVTMKMIFSETNSLIMEEKKQLTTESSKKVDFAHKAIQVQLYGIFLKIIL